MEGSSVLDPFQSLLPGRVGRAAMVARWKPVHSGHAAVLDGLVACADRALIGIGSSNCHDASNPFTARESRAMVERVLCGKSNYEILEVPDLGDGPRWSAMVREMFGEVDLFFTANPYVRDLLCGVYRVLHTVHLVPPERRTPIDGALVRRAMARGEAWRAMVPGAVAEYLDAEGLVERFRREFAAEYWNEIEEASHV